MKDLFRRRRSFVVPVLLVGALAIGLALFGCGTRPSTAPDGSSSNLSTNLAPVDLQAVRKVIDVQNRHTSDLMRVHDVVAVGTGLDETGRPVIHVFSANKLPEGRLSGMLEGVRVVEIVNGPIIAMKGGGGGVSHNGFCCGGTLGSLVSKGGTQYILSNSHVFAGDVVSGGNGRVSQVGDDVTQPGLIDIGCVASNGQVVADVSTLSTTFPPTSTPNVDCSIAQVRSGMVRTDGAILEIGTLSSATVGASINQQVKKSGRTTGLTRSKVSDVNVTVNVGYTDECGGTAYTKLYTGQVFITNRGSKFLNSGDSGSLMVEDVTTNPRAVGLLFAGGGGIAVANPIGDVLSHLGATMVGN